MSNRKLLKNNFNLSDKEIIMLNRICKMYGFKFKSALKVRSAYKVILDNDKAICIKKMKNGRKKIISSYNLVEDLMNNGFKYTARYLKTKNSHIYVKYKNLIFFATEWIDGSECNLNNVKEAAKAASLMAKFHRSTENLDTSKYNLKNNLKNWPKIYMKNLNDLDNFKNIINNKKLKNEFDLKYLSNIDKYYDRGLKALNIINTSEYYKISKKASEAKTICHNSFYYQNILDKNEEFYLIDLNRIIIDINVNDLGKFIRRLMYKKEYEWNFDYAKPIIESYNSEYELCKSDLQVMLSLIMFPHKFWKLGKKRYIKHKNWTENKYIHKINTIISYYDYEEKFYHDYIDYLSNSKQ